MALCVVLAYGGVLFVEHQLNLLPSAVSANGEIVAHKLHISSLRWWELIYCFQGNN